MRRHQSPADSKRKVAQLFVRKDYESRWHDRKTAPTRGLVRTAKFLFVREQNVEAGSISDQSQRRNDLSNQVRWGSGCFSSFRVFLCALNQNLVCSILSVTTLWIFKVVSLGVLTGRSMRPHRFALQRFALQWFALQGLASFGPLSWRRLGGLIVIALIFAPKPHVMADSFQRKITPVLTKAGCNGGSCHGAAAGRGGFHLSLYGSDPAADYREIVRELGGRRIHQIEPQLSLLLQKATESVEHGGGQRLLSDGLGAKRIEQWIGAGAYWDEAIPHGIATEVGHLTEQSTADSASRINPLDLEQLILSPGRATLSAVGDSLTLTAKAIFGDGEKEDVTNWTVFEAEDSSALEIDEDGLRITVLRPGRHLVIARYLTEVVPVEIVVPFNNAKNSAEIYLAGEAEAGDVAGTDKKQVIQSNLSIDQRINERLVVLNIPASPRCDDATYLRRAAIDLIGRLPTSEQTKAYLAKPADQRRQWWVDTLISSEAFDRYWTLQLAKLFRLRRLSNAEAAMQQYHQWIGEQLRSRVGYDQIVRSLLIARGNPTEVGPANFLRTAEGPRQRAELVSEVFMASRLRCANCHDHPLDRWTQDDYHGLSAVFATIAVGDQVADKPDGTVTHPKTGQDALPKLPGGAWITSSNLSKKEGSAGGTYVNWLLDDDNPYFAKAIVNRLWRAMMGRGLVEPVDDFRQTNPATHPELLDELAEQFVRSRYDLRDALRRIALTDAYQRSSDTLSKNQWDDEFYSRYYERPLPAEVLADAISDVIGISAVYGNEPPGTRAVDLVDPKVASRALDVLGRCSRESSCEVEGDAVGQGVSAKLFVLNNAFINERLKTDESRLAKFVAKQFEPLDVIQSFYEVALQRTLNASEQNYWRDQLEKCDPTKQETFLQDFVWSLLACGEFTTNH